MNIGDGGLYKKYFDTMACLATCYQSLKFKAPGFWYQGLSLLSYEDYTSILAINKPIFFRHKKR